MTKREVKVKGVLDLGEAVTILEGLLEGLKGGTVCVEGGQGFLTLRPSESVLLEVEAKSCTGKEKLEIEMSWRDRIPVIDKASGFRISSRKA
jgi:amphi-Trp domain-containing protein